MLVLLSAGGQLDAGSVALALARRWCHAGEQVVLVDADPAGSRLAKRLSAAAKAGYSPAERGLPSLIVTREPLTLSLLADHCYSLDTDPGSLWTLFAPQHPDGAAYAAGWLADRAADLAAVSLQRRVIVSASLGTGDGLLLPLLQAAPAVAVLAPVVTAEQAQTLTAQCGAAGLAGGARPRRVLVVEGDSHPDDADISSWTGMSVAGRLPVVDDEKVLLLQCGRRDRAFLKNLDRIAGHLLTLAGSPMAAAAVPAPAPGPPRPPVSDLAGSLPLSSGNGRPGPSLPQQRI